MERSIEDTIKDRYSALRRQFNPGYAASDAKCGQDWDDAASIVRTIGAEPDLFVEAQFHAASLSGRNPFPWPSQLHSRDAAENYQKYITHYSASPEAKVEQQNTLLKAQLETVSLHNIDIALSKSILPFKSWFRILMCSDANLEKFKEVWGEHARMQMRNDKGLHKFLKGKYELRAHRLL